MMPSRVRVERWSAWARFWRKPVSRHASRVLAVIVAVAIAAPLVASSKPLVWHTSKCGWSSPWLVSLFDRTVYESSVDIAFNVALFPGVLFLAAAWLLRQLRRWRGMVPDRRWTLALFAAWSIVVIALVASSDSRPSHHYPAHEAQLRSEGVEVIALYPPLPYSYRRTNLAEVGLSPSFRHPLGTDNSGRDVLTRLVYGTRISLTVGVLAVVIYVVIGTLLGAVAGFYGGWVDAVIQRVIEVVLSIPSLFIVLTVAAFIERRSVLDIMLIIAAVRWTTPARLVRAEVLRLRNLEFVTAARALGFSERSIVWRHVLPNALGPLWVTATFGVAAAILIESAISFLGLGDMSAPSWGQILSVGHSTGSWTLILAPGFAIFVTVSVLNLVGEGLRDALDPRLRS